jgi:hypothetical protein
VLRCCLLFLEILLPMTPPPGDKQDAVMIDARHFPENQW